MKSFRYSFEDLQTDKKKMNLEVKHKKFFIEDDFIFIGFGFCFVRWRQNETVSTIFCD